MHPSVKYCFQGEARLNFGDALPVLFDNLFSDCHYVPGVVYRMVGSVIDPKWMEEDFKHGTHLCYWGCGMRQALPLIYKYQSQHFPAVRGPLTRDLLKLPQRTPIGDTGLLAPLFHSLEEDSLWNLCIPHINELTPWVKLLQQTGTDQVCTPWIMGQYNIAKELIRKIGEIARAKFVLTGSLHGAVIAAAYRKPFAFWNSGYINVPFKWVDFAASLNIPCKFVSNLKEGQEWYAEIESKIEYPRLKPLLDSAPFTVKPEFYKEVERLGL